jgi:hypothetical protein
MKVVGEPRSHDNATWPRLQGFVWTNPSGRGSMRPPPEKKIQRAITADWSSGTTGNQTRLAFAPPRSSVIVAFL